MEMEQIHSEEHMISQLLDMGFSQSQAECAYKSSPNKSIEGLILYLEAQQQKAEGIIQLPNPELNKNPPSDPNQPSEEKKEEKPFVEQTQEISSMVNQTFSMELQLMGYSKNVSEKALFLTQNLSLEKALDWITENSKSPDFEEELRMLGRAEEGPKLSKEEAAQKAKDLQQKIREKRLLREKEEEQEREKNRIKGGKAMSDARRELDELQMKRDMDLKMKQKREDELAKQKILLQLERDRQERFGKKGGVQHVNNPAKEAKILTPVEKIEGFIKQLKIAYPGSLFPGAWNTALKTILIYLENIVKNPVEEKFRRINLGNENFHKKVGSLIGGIGILQECGFVEEGGFLLLKSPDVGFLKTAIQFIAKATN